MICFLIFLVYILSLKALITRAVIALPHIRIILEFPHWLVKIKYNTLLQLTGSVYQNEANLLKQIDVVTSHLEEDKFTDSCKKIFDEIDLDKSKSLSKDEILSAFKKEGKQSHTNAVFARIE
jgi:hypothetical protein